MSMGMQQNGAGPSDTIDLADAVRAVRRGWAIALAVTLLGTVAAVGVLRWAPRKFTGVASVVLRAEGGAGSSVLSSLGALAGSGGAGGLLSSVTKSPLETETAILQSRKIIGRVVDSLRLQARIMSPIGLASQQVLAVVDAPRSFKEHRYTFRRTGPGAEYNVSWNDSTASTVGGSVALPSGRVTVAMSPALPAELVLLLTDREDAITRVAKHLSIDKPTGELVKLDYRGDDSLTAAAVPNAILSEYLEWRRTTDRGANQRKVDSLSHFIDTVSTKLRRAEDALRRDADSSGMLDPTVQGRLDLESAEKIRGQLAESEIESSSLQLLLAQVAAGTITPLQLTAYPTFLKSPAFTALSTEISTIETERARLLAKSTENDPLVKQLTQREQEKIAEIVPQATAYATSVNRQLLDTRHQLDSAEAVIATLPGSAEANERLEREVQVLSRIYAEMQGQLEDARLAAIGEGGDVHPLDAAVPPKKPTFPEPVLTMAAGIGGGAVVGLILALMLGALGKWVRDPRDVERAAGVPALRFDPAVPLLMSGSTSRTILVAPLDDRALTEPVVQRLIKTALSQALTATVLDLSTSSALTGSNGGFDANRAIESLEAEYGLVVVKLPAIASDAAAATMRHNRPVLLVAPERRVDRAQLTGTVDLLRRLGIPCAGVVLGGRGTNGVPSPV